MMPRQLEIGARRGAILPPYSQSNSAEYVCLPKPGVRSSGSREWIGGRARYAELGFCYSTCRVRWLSWLPGPGDCGARLWQSWFDHVSKLLRHLSLQIKRNDQRQLGPNRSIG